MPRIKSSTLFLMFALFVLPVSAQDANHSEIAVNFSGNFQAQEKGFGVTDTASDAGGALAVYRYHFNQWSAIEVNYSYTRFSQTYSPSGGSITQANAQEFTLAYVNSLGTRPSRRIRPFVEAGTGGVIFSPVAAGSTVGGLTQDRAVLLVGAGVDWRAIRRVSLRLGYRGLVYKAPDFSVPAQVTNATTIMSEPYLGVVVRF
jgi:outer membrane immunogenic protein